MTAECGLYMLQNHKRISRCDVRFSLKIKKTQQGSCKKQRRQELFQKTAAKTQEKKSNQQM